MAAPYWGPPAWQTRWVNERGKSASQKPLTAEVSAKQSIKRQLHTTHVGAVGWEPHSSSTTACAGRVDHELPVNFCKRHTYTTPRPGRYLTHALSQITRAVAAMEMAYLSLSDRGKHVFFFVFQAPPATDPVVQWLVQWPNDITILDRAGVQWLCRATPEGGFTSTPKSPRN